MPLMFTVHFTITATGERLSDTVTADNPNHAATIVRTVYKGQTIHVRKVKHVKGSGHETNQARTTNRSNH